MAKIIVGVDESDRGKDAIALASQLARGSDAEIVLVNSYAYDDTRGRGANTAYRTEMRDEAARALQRACEEFPDLGEVERRTIAEISPAKGIQELAMHGEASLIVIGPSHRGVVGRVLAGTTAERLLHGAPCPVAVAPKGYRAAQHDGFETIGVAYDRSEESRAALAGAIALARAHDARLRIIEVLDGMSIGTPALMSGPGYIMPPEELEARARAHLAEIVARLPKDVAGETVLGSGDPEGELAAQARIVDLMVVGSRGYGPHRAVLLGSVSGRLVRDAACPVVVVPRGIEAPLEALCRATAATQMA